MRCAGNFSYFTLPSLLQNQAVSWLFLEMEQNLSPQQFLLGFCMTLCLSPIKAVNTRICIKYLAYFNTMKESSMNSPLNHTIRDFCFCFSEKLWVPFADHLRNKERGKTQRYPVLLRYRQIKPTDLCLLIHSGGIILP